MYVGVQMVFSIIDQNHERRYEKVAVLVLLCSGGAKCSGGSMLFCQMLNAWQGERSAQSHGEIVFATV